MTDDKPMTHEEALSGYATHRLTLAEVRAARQREVEAAVANERKAIKAVLNKLGVSCGMDEPTPDEAHLAFAGAHLVAVEAARREEREKIHEACPYCGDDTFHGHTPPSEKS